jgi:proteasome lid subunit RPN8/RPN11
MLKINVNKRGQSNLLPILDHSDFVVLNLEDYLSDSRIEHVCIHREFIKDVYQWSETSLEVNELSIDEVGGFILGQYYLTDKNRFIISCDVFCPAIEVDDKSPTKLIIGEKANIALEAIFEEYHHLCLIGWFHTHPGHSPYLSKTDLDCTHELFYKKEYQIAIVLDPTTIEFDTGIFTRKSTNQMNNKCDYKAWIGWRQLL